MSKLPSICSRSRLEGTIISVENPNLLSFSGFTDITSDLYKIDQAGLSKLRFDVKKKFLGKITFYNIVFLFFSDFRISSKNTSDTWWRITARLSKFSSNTSFYRSSVTFRRKKMGFYKSQSFCIFNNIFRTPIGKYSAGLSKLQSRV